MRIIKTYFAALLLSITFNVNAGPFSILTNGVSYSLDDVMTVSFVVYENDHFLYDIYVAIVLPDGSWYAIDSDGNFRENTPAARFDNYSYGVLDGFIVANFAVPNWVPTGNYAWYVILTPPGSDVLNPNNWSSYATKIVHISGEGETEFNLSDSDGMWTGKYTVNGENGFKLYDIGFNNGSVTHFYDSDEPNDFAGSQSGTELQDKTLGTFSGKFLVLSRNSDDRYTVNWLGTMSQDKSFVSGTWIDDDDEGTFLMTRN